MLFKFSAEVALIVEAGLVANLCNGIHTGKQKLLGPLQLKAVDIADRGQAQLADKQLSQIGLTHIAKGSKPGNGNGLFVINGMNVIQCRLKTGVAVFYIIGVVFPLQLVKNGVQLRFYLHHVTGTLFVPKLLTGLEPLIKRSRIFRFQYKRFHVGVISYLEIDGVAIAHLLMEYGVV